MTGWKGCSAKLVSPEFRQNFQIWGLGRCCGLVRCQNQFGALTEWNDQAPPTSRLSTDKTNRWLHSYGLILSKIVTNPSYLDFLKVVSQMSKLVAGVTKWRVQAPPTRRLSNVKTNIWLLFMDHNHFWYCEKSRLPGLFRRLCLKCQNWSLVWQHDNSKPHPPPSARACMARFLYSIFSLIKAGQFVFCLDQKSISIQLTGCV